MSRVASAAVLILVEEGEGIMSEGPYQRLTRAIRDLKAWDASRVARGVVNIPTVVAEVLRCFDALPTTPPTLEEIEMMARDLAKHGHTPLGAKFANAEWAQLLDTEKHLWERVARVVLNRERGLLTDTDVQEDKR